MEEPGQVVAGLILAPDLRLARPPTQTVSNRDGGLAASCRREHLTGTNGERSALPN